MSRDRGPFVRAFATLVLLSACGGDDADPPDAPSSFPPASLAQLVAFEGHRTLVNEVTVGGASLLGATIAPADDAPIDVVQQRCTQDRCGVVLSIRDETPNRGAGVPSPIDATNHFVEVTLASGDVYRGLLSVQPLDVISNSGSSATVSQPIVLASSLNVADRSEFIAGAPGPIRWVVFGDATFGDATFELGPSDEGPRAGGFAGGLAMAAGEGSAGQGGGAGLEGAGGGGGGGRAELGSEGEVSGVTMGGSGGNTPIEGAGECISDFARSDCGGGGGGGALGSGGSGGGALLLVTLGTLDGGGRFRAAGGAGTDGAGGGGGGEILLAGRALVVAETDVNGGAGNGPGGVGGAGTVRQDTLVGAPGGKGVAVDIPESVLLDVAEVTLSGVAPVAADVEIRVEGTTLARFVSDGTWTGAVTLSPGLNRLQVVALVDGRELRSWSGNGIELGRVEGSPQALPLGATLDLVYLP